MNWNKLIRNTLIGGACFAAGYLLTDPSIFEHPVIAVLIPVAIIGVSILMTRKK